MATGCAGTLHVDLGALVDNYRSVARRNARARVAAVVKADAYGLGARFVAPALAAAGCRHFFVALLCEALALRPLLGEDCALFVLNGLMPGDESACAAQAIIPVLNSSEQIAGWAGEARRLGRTLPAALQVDTGMSRLGLSSGELDRIVADRNLLTGIDIRLIMSHLACADEPSDPMSATQLGRFANAATHFPGALRSIDNSGGIWMDRPDHGDIVRPGIILYGAAAQVGRSGLARVVTLESRIIQLRDVDAGDGVGYGMTHRFVAPARLATIAAGYADGWPRSLSGRGQVFIGGHAAPIVGRVSMDSMTVDVTQIPDALLRPGARVELIGPNQSLDALAEQAGTISYEILTRLGTRYERRYIPAASLP